MAIGLSYTLLAGGHLVSRRWPPGYRTHCWWEDNSFLVDGHRAIVHIAGGKTSLSQLMATRLSYILLAGGHLFPSWWPPGYRTHCWRKDITFQVDGHQAIVHTAGGRTSLSKLMATKLSYTLLAGGHFFPSWWRPSYRTHCWREEISILADGLQSIVHIAGGRTSNS